jgi:hypothetical protein
MPLLIGYPKRQLDEKKRPYLLGTMLLFGVFWKCGAVERISVFSVGYL